MKWTPEKLAGITYALPILGFCGIWYILMFAHDPPNVNYGERLHMWFFEVPERAIFWWLSAFPVLCLIVSAAYLSPVAQKRRPILVLCGVGIVMAAIAWLVLDSALALAVTLPLMFSIPGSWHLTTRSSGP